MRSISSSADVRRMGGSGNGSSRRRRSSVSPPPSSNSNRTHATRARSAFPTGALVTPPARQRGNVRDLLLTESGNLNHPAALAAPALASLATTASSNNTNNASNGNSGTNNTSGNWLGNVGNALARSPRHTRSNNSSSTPTTPTSNRRRLVLPGLRQGSIGSLLGLDGNPVDVTGATSAPCTPTAAADAKRNNSAAFARSHLKGSSESQQQQQQNSSNSKVKSVRKHHILQMTKRLHQHHSKRWYPHGKVLAVLEFWRTTCPAEVTLKMLAFLGPQIMLQLQRTQRNIHHLLEYDVSWRVLCEELYKWRPGDPKPESWKEHYRVNPCIPVDFSSMGLALAVVGTGWTLKQYKRYSRGSSPSNNSSGANPEIQNDLTLWLRPDKPHLLPQAIAVSTLRRSTTVTIRTMRTASLEADESDLNSPESLAVSPRYESSPNQPEECHPDSARENNHSNHSSDEEDNLSISSTSSDEYERDDAATTEQDGVHPPKRTRALLKSKTRRRNEPLFRVLRGQLVLQDVELEHSCLGVDIWNGNAAIQIQPTYLHAGGSIVALVPSATCVVNQSTVMSLSGRGIVTVDGGQLLCDGSYIHNCAATGVYVGGRGSCATLTKTDVWSNGTGNPHLAGGIARGHSGIYVEQAKRVELHHCSVSYNTASGISMIGNPQVVVQQQEQPNGLGGDNNTTIGGSMTLIMKNSCILSNGCNPIDVPHTAFEGGEGLPLGNNNNPTIQFPWQLPENRNRIAVAGVPQAQSIPLMEELKRQKEAALEQKRKKESRKKKKKRGSGRRSSSSGAGSSTRHRRELSWNAAAPWNF